MSIAATTTTLHYKTRATPSSKHESYPGHPPYESKPSKTTAPSVPVLSPTTVLLGAVLSLTAQIGRDAVLSQSYGRGCSGSTFRRRFRRPLFFRHLSDSPSAEGSNEDDSIEGQSFRLPRKDKYPSSHEAPSTAFLRFRSSRSRRPDGSPLMGSRARRRGSDLQPCFGGNCE